MNILKKLVCLALLLSLCLSVVACGEYKPPVIPDGDKDPIIGGEMDDDPTNDFTVTLRLNEQPYKPTLAIDVYWSDGYDIFVARVDENGIARIDGLDGDYNVTLSSVPSGYTYDTNGYVATNLDRNITLDLYELNFVTDGGDSLGNTKKFTSTGIYSVTITEPGQWVYFEFLPEMNGVYTVESWASITDDEINPRAIEHIGSAASGYFFDQREVTEVSTVGSFTRNFLYTVNIADDHISSSGGGQASYVFSVTAEAKSGVYPVTFSFAVKRNGGFDLGFGEKVMVDVEADMSRFDFDAFNALAGGEKVGAEVTLTNAQGTYSVYQDDYYKLWEIDDGGDGVYHVYDEVKYASTGGYGPVLFAYISAACKYIDLAFTEIEYVGNSALTVSTTENYKHFIEGFDALVDGDYYCVDECTCHDGKDGPRACPPGCPTCHRNCRGCPPDMIGKGGYAAWCNGDGVAPVTEELKIFLQKFSISKRYFADGDGIAEKTGVYAYEDSQWLFACGYYVD
ncbi:MAG: hypothetical protein IKC32_00765 [Clostridia bacterium]|nr:hypothetical protein [Clostridia bacterium]